MDWSFPGKSLIHSPLAGVFTQSREINVLPEASDSQTAELDQNPRLSKNWEWPRGQFDPKGAVLRGSSYLGLVVVLHGHGDDVDADDEGDEEVEVVAGAQAVDVSPRRRVVGVVGPALGFCRGHKGHQ